MGRAPVCCHDVAVESCLLDCAETADVTASKSRTRVLRCLPRHVLAGFGSVLSDDHMDDAGELEELLACADAELAIDVANMHMHRVG